MSFTTTKTVPGVELAEINHREPNQPLPTPSTRKHETPYRDPNPHPENSYTPSEDHNPATETINPPTRTFTLAAQETKPPIPIPTVRLTTSTEQGHPSSTAGGGQYTPDANVGNVSMGQTGSGPPSPAPLSIQSTLVPLTISSVHTSQTDRPIEALFPGISRIVKADSIHYKRIRHILGKVFSLTTIVVTLLGVFIYSMRAYVLAKWTSAKDFWEYCNSPITHDTHCQSLQGKHLSLPPYDSERFFLIDRSLPYLTNSAPKTASHLWVIGIIITSILLIAAAFLFVYFATKRPKPAQVQTYLAPNDCNVRTQIPISWATDLNRNIYLDESYSTSTATDFTYPSSTHNILTRHASIKGPQQSMKRLKISSNLKDPSHNGSPHLHSQSCHHDWHSERYPRGWRDLCKKCKLEVVDGPTHGEFKAKLDQWEEKRTELKDGMKVDLEERRNRASVALHKTGNTLMKIINREPLDGTEQVGEVRLGADGHAELELSPARLGALGLMR